MFGFDWNNDGKETLFDDLVTANVVFGQDINGDSDNDPEDDDD